MKPMASAWTIGALVTVLVIFAIFIGEVFPLIGAALVATWAVNRQVAFLQATITLARDIELTQTPTSTQVRPDESINVELNVERRTKHPLDLMAAAGLPPTGVTDRPIEVALDATERTASTTEAVTWPVAGRHAFTSASVTAEDGLFSHTFPAGNRPAVVVQHSGAHAIHVGAGGNRVRAAYGAHKTDQVGGGIQPAHLRQYVPGDASKQIDWKATARLAELYVREFEVKTDRSTLLIVDQRASLSDGPNGQTKIDILRSVAFSTLAQARQLSDPVGLVTVDEDAIITHIPPGNDARTYQVVHDHLINLRVESAPSHHRPATRQAVPVTSARAKAADLVGGTDPFERTLHPYFDEYGAYYRLVHDRPLFSGVQESMARTAEAPFTIIFTDDTARDELRETIRYAAAEGSSVLVFIAPSILYDALTTVDLDAAYRAFHDFEEYRRSLARHPHVTALEVGPRDRLAAILDAASDDRQRRVSAT